ncbi:U3 small nucleolar RNA-associated protein 14 homolog A-like [Orycteropus afer afer]|uniref:U3 small nucleolar RNA-associated protein 14 homolog A-like n=1 Tax=Orycteropus afer afer TaxID=1230840 RepID=A0A8B7A5B6_ORYAF|nr:U3 small nucleolar RNA-associated protein 14 homolog A-like [Orycteropus afer afer]
MSAAGAAENLLALCQQEELVDLPKDYTVSTSEDEGDSDREWKHRKLLEAIRSLDGKSRWESAERSEAHLNMSEFNVSSEGIGDKLVLADLLQPSKASSSLAAVRKQLKRVQSKTVELPLCAEEVARIHREVAFSQTSQALSKWDPIVVKNRKAEQLAFPLQKEPGAFAPIEHVLRGWKARTALEEEIYNVLHKNKQPVLDPLLTPAEKASLKAMSLEEAKLRRAELQRARALQSYYEARARREKRIKSRKYRRAVKKGKAKKALRELEALGKVCPTAALGRETTGKARMMERLSLRHQDNGKRAKSRAVRARYDPAARQAMQEQWAKNKELVQKLQEPSESEEEEGGAEEVGLLVPDVSHRVPVNTHGPNPWMHRSCTSDAREAEIQKDPAQLPRHASCGGSEREEEESPVAEEEPLKEFEERPSLRKRAEPGQDAEPVGQQETQDPSSQEVLSELRALSLQLGKESHRLRKQRVDSVGAVLLVQDEKEPLLLQRPEGVRPLEELEALGLRGCLQNTGPPRCVFRGQQTERNPDTQPDAPRKKKRVRMIDLQDLLTTHSPGKSMAGPTVIEELEGEEERDERQMIKDAFAGDDVIRDFLDEKRAAVEANKPKDVDLMLPGWGEWGGVGLQPGARKRRRFLMKAPERPPRKDENLPNVVISEKRNICAAVHQVHALPFPFTHRQQFKRTIQTPAGSTWNTQRAFQKLTMPRVVTKPGHIITPLSAEDVGYRSSSRSDLSVVQRNPKPLSIRHKKWLKKSSVA